jgi:DNA polymerase-3 subunit gamma/tau
LEVGANIRERYRVQAQQSPLPFLYRAMKLSNDCDINYRVAKNKRLLIELTLIQIAQITVSGDKDTSSGHSPKQEIKPIFTQPAANQSAIGNLTPDTTTPVTATTASILQSKAVEEKKIPSMKGAEMGFSIKNTQRKVIQKTSVSNNEQSQPTSVPKENHPFDENRLNYYWQEYAKQMSLERKAIAMRMQNIRVTLLNETSFEVVVDNEIAAKDFTTLIPELQSYLRDCLKNQEIKMTIRVSEPMENVRAISRTEKFQSMVQKNKMLLLLKDEFELEFS